jgi:hypothetical protein
LMSAPRMRASPLRSCRTRARGAPRSRTRNRADRPPQNPQAPSPSPRPRSSRPRTRSRARNRAATVLESPRMGDKGSGCGRPSAVTSWLAGSGCLYLLGEVLIVDRTIQSC